MRTSQIIIPTTVSSTNLSIPIQESYHDSLGQQWLQQGQCLADNPPRPKQIQIFLDKVELDANT